MPRSTSSARTSSSTVPRSSPTTKPPARCGLEGDEVEDLVRCVAHVGARRSGRPPGGIQYRRNSPITWSMRMPAQWANGRAHRADERLVARRPQLPGHERRQPPVLAERVERVGRRADPAARREEVLVGPAVGTARVEADGEVADQAEPRGAGGGQLAVDLPLAPLVEPDAAARCSSANRAHGRGAGWRYSAGQRPVVDAERSASAQ